MSLITKDDPRVKAFIEKYGLKNFLDENGKIMEIPDSGNQSSEGMFVLNEGDPTLYGHKPEEFMQDSSRIMQITGEDGKTYWLYEAGNIKPGEVAGYQRGAETERRQEYQKNAKIAAALAAAGYGMMGGFEGLFGGAGAEGAIGLDALETFTAANPGWESAIAEALAGTGPIPEVSIPDLMDPLNPTEIPGLDAPPTIETPSVTPNAPTPPEGWESLGPGDGMSPPQDSFDQWLENYLSDSGSTTELPYGEEAYRDLGIIDGAESVAGTFEGLEAPSWLDRLTNFGSSALNRLPALTNALKYALPNGQPGGGGRPSLGGLGGGGGGGFGGGGGRAGMGGDAFEAEKLKKILTLSEYLGSLK